MRTRVLDDLRGEYDKRKDIREECVIDQRESRTGDLRRSE